MGRPFHSVSIGGKDTVGRRSKGRSRQTGAEFGIAAGYGWQVIKPIQDRKSSFRLKP